MRMVLAAAVMMVPTMSLAQPEFHGDLWNAEWETYRTFLVEPNCGDAKDLKACETQLNMWRRDFMWAVDARFGGLLIGQRNMTHCFATGCDNKIKKNPLLACAWAGVVVNGGQPQIEDRDLVMKRELCGELKQDGKAAAEMQTKRLLKMLYE